MIGVGGSGDLSSARFPKQNPNGASLAKSETLGVNDARKVQKDLKYTCKYEVKKFLSEALKNKDGGDGFLQKAGELIFLKNLMEKLKKDTRYTINKIEYEEEVDLKKMDRFFKIKSIEFTGGTVPLTLKKETINKYVATFKDTLKSNLDKLCSLRHDKHYDYTLGFEDSLNSKTLISGSIKDNCFFLNWNQIGFSFSSTFYREEAKFGYTNFKAKDYVSKTSLESTVSSDSGKKVEVFNNDKKKRKSQIKKYLKELKTEKYELAKELSQQSELESQQSELAEKIKKMLKLMILENYLKQAREKNLDLKELHLSTSGDSRSLSDVDSLFIKKGGKIYSYTFDFTEDMCNYFKDVLATIKKKNNNKLLNFKLKVTSQDLISSLDKISGSNFRTLLNIEKLDRTKIVKRRVINFLSTKNKSKTTSVVSTSSPVEAGKTSGSDDPITPKPSKTVVEAGRTIDSNSSILKTVDVNTAISETKTRLDKLEKEFEFHRLLDDAQQKTLKKTKIRLKHRMEILENLKGRQDVEIKMYKTWPYPPGRSQIESITINGQGINFNLISSQISPKDVIVDIVQLDGGNHLDSEATSQEPKREGSVVHQFFADASRSFFPGISNDKITKSDLKAQLEEYNKNQNDTLKYSFDYVLLKKSGAKPNISSKQVGDSIIFYGSSVKALDDLKDSEFLFKHEYVEINGKKYAVVEETKL
jgi:hypothetical protein